MDVRTLRKGRLERLLDLAQAYKGCSRKELARILRRDRTKLVPSSGIPKLDLVVDLSKLLDWPIAEVAGFLSGEALETASEAVEPPTDYEELQVGSRDAQRNGQYGLAVTLARQAFGASQTPEHRALACNREAVAWDGLGYYATALEAEQRGLREPGISLELRHILESNLANAYYTLWSLTEARSVARDLIDWYARNAPATYRDQCTQAFAFYVRGHTMRRMMAAEPEHAASFADSAVADLQASHRLYNGLAKEYQEDSFAGIANTCKGGIIEAEVSIGRREPGPAIAELEEGLDAVIDPAACPPGDWLESYGWWCIFGCNIALRHVNDERELQRAMAVFTNKADEIADRMNSWSLRERVFSMQFASQQRFLDWTGRSLSMTLDHDDLRSLVGTMGRFPTFRDTGWRLLETARVVRDG